MDLATNTVNAVQKVQKKSQCGNCTKSHSPADNIAQHRTPHAAAATSKGTRELNVGKLRSQTQAPRDLTTLQGNLEFRKWGKNTDEVGVSEGDPYCDEITIHA